MVQLDEYGLRRATLCDIITYLLRGTLERRARDAGGRGPGGGAEATEVVGGAANRHYDHSSEYDSHRVGGGEHGHGPGNRATALRAHRTHEHGRDLRRRGARPGRSGHRRPGARPVARVRHQPHRHRALLRRCRASDRPLDGPPPGRLLPRDQDPLPRLRRRPGRDRPLARAAAHRPGRPAAAARPDPSRRMGAGARARRRPRGRARGA